MAISALRTLGASIPLAIWCVALLYVAPASGLLPQAVWLALTIAGGSAVFLAASVLFGCPERATLLGVLPSRRRR